MKYKIADLIVEYDAKYEMTQERSKRYLIDTEDEADIVLELGDKQIKAFKNKHPDITLEEAEYILLGTKFYKELNPFNGCLLHSSAVVIDGEAYLFSADCGTGKSTHTSLWLKYLANMDPYILNDDKPAIRVMETGIYSYGTPFSGKNDISENSRARVKAICFIEQSKTNSIEELDAREAINLFFAQTLRRFNEEQMHRFLDMLADIIEEIPIYKLSCNMSKEAVLLSYNTLKGD